MKRVSVLQLSNGEEPFRQWLQNLEAVHRASIRVFIDRVAAGGSRKNVKSLGDRIFEIKINRGPGFRVYFGEVGRQMILLLLGGDKSSQKKDVIIAKKYWREYVSQRLL